MGESLTEMEVLEKDSESLIDILPDEMIIKIMSFLPLAVRKSTRLVCKRWYQLSFAHQLIENDVTCVARIDQLNEFGSNASEIQNDGRNIFSYSRHPNLRVGDLCTENGTISKFWRIYGNEVRCLQLGMCCHCVESPILNQILLNCCNVARLQLMLLCTRNTHTMYVTVSDIQNWSPVTFPNLKRIDLRGCSLIPISLIDNIISNAPKIYQLYIIGIQLIGIDEKWCDIIAVLAKRHSSKIKELSLDDLSMNTLVFEKMAKLTRLDMRKVNVWRIPNDSNDEGSLKYLKQLHAYDMHPKLLVYLLENSKNLTNVTISERIDPHTSDRIIEAIQNLDHLTSIDLSYNTPNVENLATLYSKTYPNITDLKLNGVFTINDEVLNEICQSFPNLESLSLAKCGDITEDGVKSICEYNKKLAELNLSHCYNIASFGSTTPCINELINLVHLNLSHCVKLSTSFLQNLHLTKLRSINLIDTPLMESDLDGLKKNCPLLARILR